MTAREREAMPSRGLRGSLAFPSRRDLLPTLVVLSLASLVPWLLAGAITIQWLPAFAIGGPTTGFAPFVVALGLEFMLALLALKVAVEALLDTAHHRTGPVGEGGVPATDRQAVQQLLLLTGVVALAYTAALAGGTAAAWAVLVLAAAVVPAMSVLLAMDGGARDAANPFAVAALVERLGPAYARAVATLAALVLATLALQAALRWALPGVLATPLARFAGLWALVAGYHALGHLLYARHAALGIDVAPVIEHPQIYASHEEAETVAQAEALAVEGRHAEAAASLHALMRRRGASGSVHAFYRTLLLHLGDRPALAAHAREYAATLLALGDDKHALALVADQLRLDPAFALDDPAAVTQLVAHADAAGHSAIAVQLAEGFGARFPKSEDIVRNGLVAARLMRERLGREADARALLQALDRAHPDHPLAGEVRAALYASR
jgi:hypothetical protein